MHYSGLTQRIGGASVDGWAVHYEAKRRLAAGNDIIVLSVGEETGEMTPAPVQQAAIESIERGRHHYTPVEGELALREAIARRHQSTTGQVTTAANVCVFAGAQNALFAAALCLLEAGDEVIVLEPYYATYPATFSASGAKLVSVVAGPEDEFQPNIDAIVAAITAETRLIVVNSPNNPTGAIYTRNRLQALVDVCAQREIWILSDEVYGQFAAPGSHTSVCSLAGAGPITITVDSVSKSHRMTGWRCGWTIAPQALSAHLSNLLMCLCYGYPPFIQDAALRALQGDIDVASSLRERLSGRFAALSDALAGLDPVRVFGQPGGMYIILDIRTLGLAAADFAWRLLDRHSVAVLPCDGFGASGKGLIRISLCESRDRLQTAAHRIRTLITSLTPR